MPTPTGQYSLRIVLLKRVLGAKLPNGEEPETFPDPAPGTGEYFAARDNLTGSEIIALGLNTSFASMRLRVKGRSVPIEATDKIRVKASGREFVITGVWTDDTDTVFTCVG